MLGRVGPRDKALLVKLRGLGFTTGEIADELGVTRQTVSYHLSKLKGRAVDEGVDKVFIDVLFGEGVEGVIPRMWRRVLSGR